MITNTGRYIIAKYLLNQVPAYASYLAIGCGAKPKRHLNFEIIKKAAEDGIATVTFDTAPIHTLLPGEYVYISNVDPRLNGTRQISDVNYTENTIDFSIGSQDTITETVIDASGLASYSYVFKENLDFEMRRIPITSRGYVRENGVSKIVLTAQLPTEDRYEITEVGVYPALNNPSASGLDSQSIFTFTENEGWVAHMEGGAVEIPFITEKISNLENEISASAPTTDDKIFIANAENEAFSLDLRIDRQERPRFLNDTIIMRGDSSSLVNHPVYGLEVEDVDAMHIHKGGITVDLAKNSPVDQMKLAFSVISKDAYDQDGLDGLSAIDHVRLMVRFSSVDHLAGEHSHDFAQMNIILGNNIDGDGDDTFFADNRYFVATSELQDMYQTSQFTWSIADYAIIYASVSARYAVAEDGATIDAGVVTVLTDEPTGFAAGHTVTINSDPEIEFTIASVGEDGLSFTFEAEELPAAMLTVTSKSANYYVALDAMRFENIASISSVYGLVGYSEVSTNYNGFPRSIVKKPNTSNFVEFRYALDVE
jgi:hypothetical protein